MWSLPNNPLCATLLSAYKDMFILPSCVLCHGNMHGYCHNRHNYHYLLFNLKCSNYTEDLLTIVHEHLHSIYSSSTVCMSWTLSMCAVGYQWWVSVSWYIVFPSWQADMRWVQGVRCQGLPAPPVSMLLCVSGQASYLDKGMKDGPEMYYACECRGGRHLH